LLSPSLPTGVPAIDVDVVIIGSGIQGLWLLADLIDDGYQAILLERMRPGFGQTGHSHVFLHEGHIYASMLKEEPQDIHQRAASVLKANGLWKAALQTGRLKTLPPLRSNFYIGWDDPRRGEQFEAHCERVAIPCQKVTTPPSEFGVLPEMAGLYKSEGICLDSTLLLDHLLNYRNLGKRVAYCKEIQVDTYKSGRFNLVTKRPQDRERRQDMSLQIRAGALVLSAGAGNEKLINRLFAQGVIPHDPDATRQQTVKTFMLVVRHQSDSLPPVSGMFPNAGGIFIVSRQDSEGRTIWLIGDKQREIVTSPGEMIAFDAATWFYNLKKHLEKLLPTITTDAGNYEWGIYEATKAERWTANPRFEYGGAFPKGYHLHNHPTTPVWLAWPTLLTFAPLVASALVSNLKQTVAPASLPTDWGVWDKFCVSLTPNECRWKTTPLLSWADFTRCFPSS
jgi:glycine/D-amino acid oxidase-like deaminating enzyme